MKFLNRKNLWVLPAIAGLGLAWHVANAQEQGQAGKTSTWKVDGTESFASIMARMTAAKPGIEKEHSAVLNERYDLSDRPAQGVTMDRGNATGRCPRQAVPPDDLGEACGDERGPDSRAESISEGVLPLAASQPPRRRLLFPHFLIDAIKQQTGET